MTLILPPDMEAFLCDYLRTHITDVDGLQVGSKKPPDYQGAYPLVTCLLYTSPSPRDVEESRMPSSA